VDPKLGRAHFWGYPTINAYGWRKPSYVEAYHTDADGDIDYAPDRGTGSGSSSTSGQDPSEFFITSGKKDFTIVIFRCVPISLYDLVDPQSLTTLCPAQDVAVADGIAAFFWRMLVSASRSAGTRPPCSSQMTRAHSMALRAFWRKKPVERIIFSTSAGFAAARFAGVEYRAKNPGAPG
jgi:hypothetical protein